MKQLRKLMVMALLTVFVISTSMTFETVKPVANEDSSYVISPFNHKEPGPKPTN
ncbi:hypothetical protein J2T56_001378 [Natronobacillus azotifigens]|uniref:Phosphatase n=1 Tax=Natronobacillus azotifigens TaxID=472978 RepID=A0A9J6RCB7_9BACI|nr:hypothetical protein [Natronobacillus azotifigens]MCZ0703183.1 hypothetical protein [Natronobacillus azotifigens]